MLELKRDERSGERSFLPTRNYDDPVIARAGRNQSIAQLIRAIITRLLIAQDIGFSLRSRDGLFLRAYIARCKHAEVL